MINAEAYMNMNSGTCASWVFSMGGEGISFYCFQLEKLQREGAHSGTSSVLALGVLLGWDEHARGRVCC